MSISKALAAQDNFSKSEVEIANYILDHKEDVLSMSVNDLAKITYTSTSSVVRLCRKIGIDGFREFKIQYAAELERQLNEMDTVNSDFPFHPGDSVTDITQKMTVMMTNSINKAYDEMIRQSKQLKAATDLILKANHLALSACGDSLLKGYLFQSNMMKIKKLVYISSVPGEHLSLTDSLGPKDCVIVVSYSGQTKYVYEEVIGYRRNQVPIIVITANPDSIIGKCGQVVLRIPTIEEKWMKLATFSSQTATEYALNILFSCIYVKNFEVNNRLRYDSLQLHKDTKF
jgi:DNA-binding MurR/RpiR family transcriptional regulator